MEKIFAIILDAMLISFSVLFLIFSLLASKNYFLDTNLLKEYKQNWSKGPILEIIKLKQDEKGCPEGSETFISTTFPGNLEGCDCTSSKVAKYNKKIYTKQCSPNKIADGCTMIFPRPEKSLLIWKGANLCVKRMKENFWELEFFTKECPIGKKNCGVIDNFKNLLCLEMSEKCPVNDIVIQPSNEKEEKLKDYTKIPLNDKFNLFFTSTKVKNPVITEVVARSHPICAHPFEGKLGQNFYPLNLRQGHPECKTKIYDYLTDYRFEELDSDEIYSFYEKNDILKYIKKFPDSSYHKPGEKDLINLYKINYFGFNKNCLENKNSQSDMTNIEQSRVKYFADKSSLLKTLCIVQFIFVVLSIVVYKFALEKMRVSFQIVLIIDCINLILLGCSLIISSIILSASDNILKAYSTFESSKCGDVITNGVMEYAFNGISKVPKYLISINVLAIIEICYMIGFYIWAFVFA